MTSFLKLKLLVAVICLLFSSQLGFAQRANETNDTWPASISDAATARRYFLETERIVRMPKHEQAEQIAHVYWMYSNTIQSVQTLTGSYFGYKIGESPTTPENKAAVKRFAVWIKERNTKK